MGAVPETRFMILEPGEQPELLARAPLQLQVGVSWKQHCVEIRQSLKVRTERQLGGEDLSRKPIANFLRPSHLDLDTRPALRPPQSLEDRPGARPASIEAHDGETLGSSTTGSVRRPAITMSPSHGSLSFAAVWGMPLPARKADGPSRGQSIERANSVLPAGAG